MIIIPDNILVGFRNKTDYTWKGTKHLKNEFMFSFVTYKENNKIKKECSWNNWRDEKIHPREFKNEPLSGYLISDNTKRSTDWFGSGRSMWRITDPRGFVFEITSENLNAIIDHCVISHGKIDQKCILTWDSGSMALVTENSDLYQEAISNTQRTQERVYLKDINLGDVVQLETGETGEFFGNQNCLFKGDMKFRKRCFIYDKKKKKYYIKATHKISSIIEQIEEPYTNNQVINIINTHISNNTLNHGIYDDEDNKIDSNILLVHESKPKLTNLELFKEDIKDIKQKTRAKYFIDLIDGTYLINSMYDCFKPKVDNWCKSRTIFMNKIKLDYFLTDFQINYEMTPLMKRQSYIGYGHNNYEERITKKFHDLNEYSGWYRYYFVVNGIKMPIVVGY